MSEMIPHWLTKQAFLAPEKEAIEVHNGARITFLELQQKSESVAKKLATLGVKKESRIAILSPNCLEMVVAIHALSYLNAVVVLLNTRLTTSELDYQIEQGNVDVVITTKRLDAKKALGHQRIFTYKEIEKLSKSDVKLATEINLNDPFTMMFTSGTTGHPKAVIHTYGNHWWSAVGSALNLGIRNDDKWLATLPLYHVGGLSILIRSVVYGMSVYLLEKYTRDGVHHALMEENVTIASLVTLMLRELVDQLGTDSYPHTLRCLLLGGGSVPQTLLENVKEKQLPVFQSYGMTETSSQIVTLSSRDALSKLGSSGKPLFPAQLKINRIAGDDVGEILVKGPMVIHGYDNNELANKESFVDGWLKTGDLGYIDEDGFLYVVDRRTDLIISGGENIYPSEIENCLLKIDGIKEAAVVGKPDETWGEVPVAFVVCNKELTAEKIIAKVQHSVAPYKIPKEVHFTHKLPRTASNKIMRHKLIDTFNK